MPARSCSFIQVSKRRVGSTPGSQFTAHRLFHHKDTRPINHQGCDSGSVQKKQGNEKFKYKLTTKKLWLRFTKGTIAALSLYLRLFKHCKDTSEILQATGRNLRAKDGELQANQAKVAISIFHYFHGCFHEYLAHVYVTKTIHTLGLWSKWSSSNLC